MSDHSGLLSPKIKFRMERRPSDTHQYELNFIVLVIKTQHTTNLI